MVEKLGWSFVEKARESFDPGFYKLAEQCGLALEESRPGGAESLLLRGHALQSQHRFSEAEAIATQLVSKRGLAFDYGLLGDILVDVGRVAEAADAYQQMLELKPDPQGYARAAHIRWLKGDLTGAVEAMRLAARGGSPRDPESAAWMHTQLARYLWQAHATDEARHALQIALEFRPGYAPALLLCGRILLADGEVASAIQFLREAAEANPLPEYDWGLAEALRAGGHEQEARAVETRLLGAGAVTDPRTCSLFLATRGQRAGLALRLAQQELGERRDVFTHDAVAWALAANGDFEEAHARMQLALAEGTADARLFFHAAVIAAKAGKIEEAGRWLTKAIALKTLLLPSELKRLEATAKMLGSPAGSGSSSGIPQFSRSFPDSTDPENETKQQQTKKEESK